jgi:hypothetical protein
MGTCKGKRDGNPVQSSKKEPRKSLSRDCTEGVQQECQFVPLIYPQQEVFSQYLLRGLYGMVEPPIVPSSVHTS